MAEREVDDRGEREQDEDQPDRSPSVSTPPLPVAGDAAEAIDPDRRPSPDGKETLNRTDLLLSAVVIQEIGLRLGVHDLSRLEWTVSVPIPTAGKLKYEVELEADLPAAMYVPHNSWDQLQAYTRLQSPLEENGPETIDCLDIDELRRDTLGIAHLIKVKRQKFERAAAGAAAHLVSALDPALPRTLSAIVAETVKLVDDVRAALDRHQRARIGDPRSREWHLVDEFLSHHLLEFFARCQRAVSSSLLAISSRLHDVGTEFTATLTNDLATRLAAEMEHRRNNGFVVPTAETGEGVALYVERGAQLKRHFEDVLFLETQRYMVDTRLRNVTGILAACLAASFWLIFTLLPISNDTRAGLSLGTFAAIFALAYAVKDRVKEQTRQWLALRLVQVYGQRAIKLRLPTKLDAARSEILDGQERFDCDEQEVADVLNQTVGATSKVVQMRYRLTATLEPAPAARKKGLGRVKHIFRYDFAPLLSRLDSSRRRVPVADCDGNVNFVEAPKEYRVPLRLCVRIRGRSKPVRESAGELVISRRGIERLEPARDAR